MRGIMCDILVATSKTTREKISIFAKNSDRDVNESQIIEYIPRMKHEENEVKLTYVSFPQVKETYSIIISRPWWIWGAEMGVNEHGLVIGNTAVFTKIRLSSKGILGMDILRLALERCQSARDALKFMVDIIENYGQGGNCSFEKKFIYSNSFIIVDPNEAWVLETAGRHWVSKKIDNVYSISNALTISDDWDQASDSVLSLSRKPNFSFSGYFSDRIYTVLARGRERREFTYKLLKAREGEITLEYMMYILRSHSFDPYNPVKGSMRDICMHYGGLLRPSQTASSLISEIRSTGISTHWFTGTSLPCLSLYKPLYIDIKPPEALSKQSSNKYSDESYWWRFERFARMFQTRYSEYIGKYSKDRNEIQEEIIQLEKTYRIDKKKREELVEYSFKKENELLGKWSIKTGKYPLLYELWWKRANSKARLVI